LTSSVLEPLRQLFRAPRPHWAVEFTPRHVIVAGVDSARKRVAGSIAKALPSDALVGSLSERNIADSDAVFDVTKSALREAGARGFEISVVLPDESSRIAFLTVDSLTGGAQERETFVRWKLKKSVPFDVDAAQIAYQVLGPHVGDDAKGVDIVVALSPKSIVHEYEELLEKLDFHAGYVVPSTLAAMNLAASQAHSAVAEDALLVKLAPESITTTVFQGGRPRHALFCHRHGHPPHANHICWPR